MDITTTQGMKQALTDKLRLGFGVTPEEADDAQVMRAAALVLRDVMTERGVESRMATRREEKRKVHYLSMEFLLGRSLEKNAYNLGVSGVLREVFEDVEYEPFGRIPDGTVRGAGMVFPFAYDSIRGSDHIKAVYRGLRLELGDVELYAADSYYDEELQQWKQSEKRVFKGQWLVCDFDRPLPGEVRLSENARVLRRQHKGDCVETESAAFNAHFLVTAEDARAAREVLTPRRMEDILAAADRSGGEVYMAFLRGGQLHVAVQTGRDFFELGKGAADVGQLRQIYLGELRWFTDIVDTLCREETNV